MATVDINIAPYVAPTTYTSIQLATYPTTDVCNKTALPYQISNTTFTASSLIYNTDNSVAAAGWYSNGTNKAYWNGSVISQYQACQLIVDCDATAASGGAGITEFIITLDKPSGGVVIMDFNAQGVPDKLEIIYNGVKKATSGMTVNNAGPFDNVYGSPNIPSAEQAMYIDQFIGADKGTAPNRRDVFALETGITDVVATRQQLIWFVYTASDYSIANTVVVRVTGVSGTAWDLERLCTNQTSKATVECKNYSWNLQGLTEDTYVSITYQDCNNVSQSIADYVGALGTDVPVSGIDGTFNYSHGTLQQV
jgi:hypothetical protein